MWSRRAWLKGAAALGVVGPRASAASAALDALEAASGGRLGVHAVTAGGVVIIDHRGDERFPMCSTFKAMLVAAVLDRGVDLGEAVPIRPRDLVWWAPVTEAHVGGSLTVAALCDAAIRVSDNVAANLLLRRVGGPAGLTRWARSLGDASFRLDRWETDLNSALPGDPRDTTTPAAMASTLAKLVLGDRLAPAARDRLRDLLVRNTTGDARIRAAVPAGWGVGDKTGTGGYGSTNDVAVVWPTVGSPFVVAVYFTQPAPDAPKREDVVAEAARIVVAAVG